MADTDELIYTGLQTKDNEILVNDLKTGFTNIYSQNGEELNFDSNTPDGQLIELLAFAGTTIREMITEVYNSCDPDKCVGSVQDNRYQINYLTRKEGSYTIQNIAVTVNQTVELTGLDASYNEADASAYAVSDNNGNVWYLIDSNTLTPGTHNLDFRAEEMGAIIPTVGTIVNPVTIIPGVISVINNVGPTSIGVEEESDADFRIRRQRSVTLASRNNIDAIEANLLALDGVVDVYIHENRTNEVDNTNTPPHSIWAIVQGGANTEIANIIYENIGGAGTKGEVIVPITTSSLEEIEIKFDRELIVPLFIKFDLKPITELGEINLEGVKEYIAENLSYDIGENAETSKITQICADALLSQGGNGYALNIEISKGGIATASTTSSTITNLQIDSTLFQDLIGDEAGTYIFEYKEDKWIFNGVEVNISNYGISYSGTPTENDVITVLFTTGEWTDYLSVESLADKFTTDKNKIYITAI